MWDQTNIIKSLKMSSKWTRGGGRSRPKFIIVQLAIEIFNLKIRTIIFNYMMQVSTPPPGNKSGRDTISKTKFSFEKGRRQYATADNHHPMNKGGG